MKDCKNYKIGDLAGLVKNTWKVDDEKLSILDWSILLKNE